MKRVALIGCGKIGARHAGNLARRVELVFCSATRTNAERFNSQFGGIGVFDHLEDILEDGEVDAIILATPAAIHKDQVVASLKAGKAVLVEKPICISAAELEEIDTAVAACPDAMIMIAENYYYKPSLALLKQIVRAGDIGQIRTMAVRKLTRQEPGGWRQSLGSLLEGGIHFLALIGDLADAALEMVAPDDDAAVRAPAAVEAQFPTRQAGEPERHVQMQLRYGQAAHLAVSLHYAWDVPSMTKGTFQHSRLAGDGGTVVFESNGIYVWLNGRRRALKLCGFGDLLGYKGMTDDFLQCLERGDEPYSNFERARRDTGIVFRAYGDD